MAADSIGVSVPDVVLGPGHNRDSDPDCIERNKIMTNKRRSRTLAREEKIKSKRARPGRARQGNPVRRRGLHRRVLQAETGRGKCEPSLESESSTLPPGVEMRGIEPRSDGARPGLLRVQFASAFLGPGVSREQGRRRAQSPKSPANPGNVDWQQWLSRRRQDPGRKHPRADGLGNSLRRRGRSRCECYRHLFVYTER